MNIDLKLEAHFWRLLANKDTRTLFTAGACAFLAKECVQGGIGKSVCTRHSTDEIDHVFVITPDNQAFDVDGFSEPNALIRARNQSAYFDITEIDLERFIATKRISTELCRRIQTAAQSVIQLHISSCDFCKKIVLNDGTLVPVVTYAVPGYRNDRVHLACTHCMTIEPLTEYCEMSYGKRVALGLTSPHS